MKDLTTRFIIVGLVILISVVLVMPTLYKAITNKEPTVLNDKQIGLGIDLQGGMHLILQVDIDQAVADAITRMEDDISSTLKKNHIRRFKLEKVDKTKIFLRINGEKYVEKFDNLLSNELSDLKIESKTDNGSSVEVTVALPQSEADYIKKMAKEQAVSRIRNRTDEFGVKEPVIHPQGEDRIVVQLPGINDAEKAKKELGRTGHLEFKLVDDNGDIQKALNGDVPPGEQILYKYVVNDKGVERKSQPFLVYKKALMTGEYLTDATVRYDEFNQPYVAISFNKKGAKLFAEITGENIHKRLAIVLDNKIHSAPTIQAEITGGDAMITGSFTLDEATSLAITLREAFPVPVKILEERTVGPSLGSDSIHKGLISMLIGSLLVVIFMIIYYNGSGIIADVALVLNVLMIAAGLAIFGATLTLPGIAGIILTIGMAVDANVLIFERIREELGIGKTVRAAVNAGFEKATLTIVDANVTTVIAAAVLIQFGTGPVKGFAVTLAMGVIASMFTALVVSKLIFDFILTKWNIKNLSI